MELLLLHIDREHRLSPTCNGIAAGLAKTCG
jgi:hypothetical protein